VRPAENSAPARSSFALGRNTVSRRMIGVW